MFIMTITIFIFRLILIAIEWKKFLKESEISWQLQILTLTLLKKITFFLPFLLVSVLIKCHIVLVLL